MVKVSAKVMTVGVAAKVMIMEHHTFQTIVFCIRSQVN